MTTKEDLSGRSRLTSNIITGWFSHILIIITGFFMPRAIDMQLGQAVVGIWDLAWSLVSYLSLAQLGIGSSLNRYISQFRADKTPEKITTASSTVTAIQFILSLLIAAISLSAYYTIPSVYGEQLGSDLTTARIVVLMLGLSIAVQFLFDTSRGILTGSHRWDIYNALYSGTQIISSLMMIGALFLGEGLITISIIYFVMLLLEGIARSYVALKICPEARFKFTSISKTFALDISQFGIKSFVMNISPIMVIQGCSLMIASTIGHAALAIFARPNALLRHIQTFITRFTFTLTPMAGPLLSTDGPNELKRFTVSCSQYGLAITLPAITLFCFFGDELIYLWMGSNYSRPLLTAILGAGFLLPLAQSPITRILIGLNYHGKAAILSIVISALLFFIGLGLISLHGHTLENYALLIAIILSLVNGVTIPVYACHKLDINCFHYIKETLIKVGLISAPASATIPILSTITGNQIEWVPAIITAYLLLIAGSYWKFLLTTQHKEKVLTVIRKTVKKPKAA